MKVLFVAGVIAATLWPGAQSLAQTYPAKPVRILVGFAPGGGIDIVARLYAPRLTEALGQSFVVENRPGAGGTIATDMLAKSPPDGHTLIMVSVTHSINASLYGKLPYDSVKSFAPVSPVALLADVIAVHPSVPVKTLRELISLAKAKPKDVSYAHAGSGTLMHVGMELFLSMANVKMLAVPYNGAGPSTLAVLGGQVPVLSTSLPPALPHARAGKLRILAVTTAQRTPLAPEFPTVDEAAGLKGYEAVVWVGLLAPANTPAAVVNRLNGEIERLQQTRELRELLASQSSDPFRATPAGFADLIRSDIEKYGRIVRGIGLKVE
ncbi:MAG: tripartite tricarboxylate transporter substrate binding protein [Betaproteobacteria bacterium]|nr:tripartite tricarboxylate transporter substrate binding protein [Betaproteobacteria bacterium]